MKKLTPRPPKKMFISDEQALRFHAEPTPGKLALQPTKPMATQRDLSLAYSPGVAVPVEAIAKDKDSLMTIHQRAIWSPLFQTERRF